MKQLRGSTGINSRPLSKRIENVPTSFMFEFADKIRKMEASGSVIDLSLGQPDVPAPAHIAAAVQRALETPITSYSASAGSSDLRSLIANKYSEESGVQTEASEVMVTSGSKHALFISLLSILDQDDEVLVHEPYFPPYAEITGLVGATLKTVPISSESNHFRLDLGLLLSSVTAKTKVILVNYPNNPAGWTLGENEVRKLVDFCSEKGIHLVSDEIYDKIVFDRRVHCHSWTFSKGTDNIIGLGSFSKTYSMVPYRLGYIIAKEGIIKDIMKAQRATVTMVSPYVQAAGVAALSGPQDFVKSRLDKYQERRDEYVRLLRNEGIAVSKPEGAFYFFVKMPELTDVMKFATKFLDEERVAVLPGAIFGKRWEGFVRISFATEDQLLRDGVTKFIEAYPSF
ncbi:MAG: aminotransferase class I/II-fold pyridoxal phosphate-dependent enzyme [Nitrososphaerota archaeon]|nr:aminotransferase class I/II-fold pyridoxal phosphate-dependent enzyme [Nitrososphaerota archaeon]